MKKKFVLTILPLLFGGHYEPISIINFIGIFMGFPANFGDLFENIVQETREKNESSKFAEKAKNNKN
ncbi:MAG: hypothetical protein KDK76_06255 [Chlamydiia bacterium]|nr:hypothetical protein [Chlamydiia bacterium]